MIIFYQEPNGDYLAIDTSTRDYYRRTFGTDQVEGRATAIAGVVESVCTMTISRAYLRDARGGGPCRRVARKDVPKAWLDAIGY